tara:strand:+ start:314 stop:520 length:207 start_codon:yes stop_codon:yes gene_type:complete
MKKLSFTVTVGFADSVNDDNEINELATNILNGLIEQANHEGLAPEESETFTKTIQISKDGKDIIKHSF